MHLQSATRGGTVWPKSELSYRKSLLREPIPLAIVTKSSQSSPGTILKQEQATREWVRTQALATELSERIDAFAAIYRLNRN